MSQPAQEVISLSQLSKGLEEEVLRLRDFLKVLQGFLSKSVKHQQVMYQYYQKRSPLNVLFPLDSVIQSYRQLAAMALQSNTVLSTKYNQMAALQAEVVVLIRKEASGKEKNLQPQVQAVVRKFRTYMQNKETFYRDIVYLNLNYNLDVYCKVAQMHMGVLEKRGVKPTQREESLHQIFD